jgi:single-strand DNA-binding protein
VSEQSKHSTQSQPGDKEFLDKNEVHLCGHLAQDPEIRYTASGKAIAKLSLCTRYKQSAQYHQVACWESLAERVAALKKGSRVQVVGRLQTTSWAAGGQRHYRTEVIAWQVVTQHHDAQKPLPPITPNLYAPEISDDIEF